MTTTSFKAAYGTLQRHAATLRDQSEPNIDDLLTIVTESVDAYQVCKQRIEAVEAALKAALDGVSGEPAAAAPVAAAPVAAAPVAAAVPPVKAPGRSATRAAKPVEPPATPPPAPASPPPANIDDMDDDIPF